MLLGEISIIWSKEDAAQTIIAMGTMVLDQEYKDRATVTVDGKGSTLTIGIAKSEDAGQYKCSVAVENNPPEVKHTVRIRGIISSFLKIFRFFCLQPHLLLNHQLHQFLVLCKAMMSHSIAKDLEVPNQL